MLSFRARRTTLPRTMARERSDRWTENGCGQAEEDPRGPRIPRPGRQRDAVQDTESPARTQGKETPGRPSRRCLARKPIPPAREARKPRRAAHGGFPGALACRATEAFSSVTLRDRNSASRGTGSPADRSGQRWRAERLPGGELTPRGWGPRACGPTGERLGRISCMTRHHTEGAQRPISAGQRRATDITAARAGRSPVSSLKWQNRRSRH